MLPLGCHLLPTPLAVEVDGRQRRHLSEESQVAPLDILMIGVMQDLDQPRAAGRGIDRRGDDEQTALVGGQRSPVWPRDRGTRWHERAVTAEECRHERVVPVDVFLRTGDGRLIGARVADRLDLPTLTHDPDHLGHRLHQPMHAAAEKLEKLGRGHVAVRLLLERSQEVVDLTLGPLELLCFFKTRHGCDRPCRTWSRGSSGTAKGFAVPDVHRSDGQALAACWWTTRFCTSVSSWPKACSCRTTAICRA